MPNSIWGTLVGEYQYTIQSSPSSYEQRLGYAIAERATAHYNSLTKEQQAARAEHSRKSNAVPITAGQTANKERGENLN